MKSVLILRHAKSSWKDSTLDDHDRPLNKRGRRDAPRMGRLLREQGLVPDGIVSSTALRARTTADEVGQACGYEGDIDITADLYHASAYSAIEVLQAQADEKTLILIVGHNPGFESLLQVLTGAIERMPTCALAQVTLPIESWMELSPATDGQLEDLWFPRNLD